MSLDHAFFYKSVNGDRVYDDTSYEHWLKKFFTSGVFLNDLQVIANDDMTVTVGAGYTNIDGKVKIFENETPLIIETAGASYPRIDSIVLERNDSERDIILKVVKGGYSSEPVPHTPVRQDGVYQLVIAEILVNAGAVKVTQADITDTRSNTELCGIVAGAVDQIDFSQVQAQFDAYIEQYKKQLEEEHAEHNADMDAYLEQMETNLDQMAEDFSAWFEGIRNQLDEDAAGHLQNQIDDIKAEMELLGGSMVFVNVDAGEYNVEGLEVNLEIDGRTYTETIFENSVVFTGVLEVGTAKITCVDEAQEIDASASIEIPCYSAYETTIVCDSSYEKWIEAGGLNPSSYKTLDALLEDEKAVRTLMTKKEAVDVLTRMKGDDLNTIINHRYSAKWINYREYAYSTLSANAGIKALMDESGMYGMYITAKSKKEPLVPTFTSNTDSEGRKVTASSEYSTEFASYNAFNDAAKGWKPTGGSAVNSSFVRYNDITPICVNSVKIQYLGTASHTVTFKLQGSNDGSIWDDLATDLLCKNGNTETYDFNNDNAYMYYKFVITNHSGNVLTSGNGYKFQLYGYQEGDTLWQPKGLVPVMTSNTAPYGVASASAIYVNECDAWEAFREGVNCWSAGNKGGTEWLQYQFVNPTCVKSFKLLPQKTPNYGQEVKNFEIVASNDGVEFDKLYSGTALNDGLEIIADMNNDKYYIYYRINVIDTYHQDNYRGIASLQFYGRQLEALIPPMTSNTAPMGKVSASSYGTQSADSASYAFNGKISNAYNWSTEGSSDKQWIQYEFEKPQVVTAICVNNNSMTSSTLFSDYVGVLKGSVDGTKWDDLTEITVKKTSTSYIGFVEFENTTAYKYYRLLSTKNNVNYGGNNYVQIDEIILYGIPDYESRTYIYEHGVEVEDVTMVATTNAILTKNSDNVYMEIKNNNVNSNVYSCMFVSKDITNYSLAFINIGNNSTHYAIVIDVSMPTANGNDDFWNGAHWESYKEKDGELLNDKQCLDITNINGVKYVVTGSGGINRKVEIEEFWLE